MSQTEKKKSYPTFSEILIISNIENTFLSLHSDINNVSIQTTAFRSRNSLVGKEHISYDILKSNLFILY